MVTPLVNGNAGRLCDQWRELASYKGDLEHLANMEPPAFWLELKQWGMLLTQYILDSIGGATGRRAIGAEVEKIADDSLCVRLLYAVLF